MGIFLVDSHVYTLSKLGSLTIVWTGLQKGSRRNVGACDGVRQDMIDRRGSRKRPHEDIVVTNDPYLDALRTVAWYRQPG